MGEQDIGAATDRTDRERGVTLILVDQVADFFFEAAEDAGLGLADGDLAHAAALRPISLTITGNAE